MTELWPFVFILLLAGTAGGFLAGLFGIGGGLIFVPVLFFVFVAQGLGENLAMAMAVSTSLACIVFTAFSSVVSHYRLQNINKNILQLWALPTVLGVALGSTLIMPEFARHLVGVFITLLFLVALNLFLNLGKKTDTAAMPSVFFQWPLAMGIAFFSVLAGVGGGAMSAPALMLMGQKAHRAIGTSAAVGLIISLSAALILVLKNTPADAPHGSTGLVNYFALVSVAVTSVVFAPLGAKLGSKLSASTLKGAFALCLILVAVSMYVKVFGF